MGHVTAPAYGEGAASYLTDYLTKGVLRYGHPDLQGRVPEFYQASTGGGRSGAGALGDAAVFEAAAEIRASEDQGAALLDFPRSVAGVGRRTLVLTSRQVKIGRRAIGRSEETPEAVRELVREAMANVETKARAVREPFQAERYREALLDEFELARSDALARVAAKRARRRARKG
jgi:hypothetical protein